MSTQPPVIDKDATAGASVARPDESLNEPAAEPQLFTTKADKEKEQKKINRLKAAGGKLVSASQIGRSLSAGGSGRPRTASSQGSNKSNKKGGDGNSAEERMKSLMAKMEEVAPIGGDGDKEAGGFARVMTTASAPMEPHTGMFSATPSRGSVGLGTANDDGLFQSPSTDLFTRRPSDGFARRPSQASSTGVHNAEIESLKAKLEEANTRWVRPQDHF